MQQPSPEQVTTIFRALSSGDPRAADCLVPYFHEELRRIARRCLRGERQGHTLQPTALLDEAYLRLVGQAGMRWQDRAHFLAWATRIMRQVLVNHGRDRRAEKRGGSRGREPLSGLDVEAMDGPSPDVALDIVALDSALEKLAAIDERKARIVELKFFGGLSTDETVEVLGVSHATIEREWRFARAWLQREIEGKQGAGD
jgi:RNA polymerase sigma factor (TIGR02999 family)